MTQYYKKYLPYIVFSLTVLIGSVTFLTASQLKKPVEEKTVVSTETEAAADSLYTPAVSCGNDKYQLKLKVEVSAEPNPDVITEEGQTRDIDNYKTTYRLSIDTYKKDGKDVPRVECVKEEPKPDKPNETYQRVLHEGKCTDEESNDDATNRYNGVKLLWVDFRSFCPGTENSSGDPFWTGQKCGDQPNNACCWNEDTPNHKEDHARQWLLVGGDPIEVSYDTDFQYNDSVKNHCGTIQHDTMLAAFLPHDNTSSDDDVSCNTGSGSTPIFYGVAQTGYSCNNYIPDPVCGDGLCKADGSETCDGTLVCPGHGGFTSGNTCRAAGTNDQCTYCGDGKKQASEACDPTDATDPNKTKCSNTCRIIQNVCGDGVCNAGETCDGTADCSGKGFQSGNACRPTTSPEKCTFCGDGIKQASEACDPTANSDPNKAACNYQCQIENRNPTCTVTAGQSLQLQVGNSGQIQVSVADADSDQVTLSSAITQGSDGANGNLANGSRTAQAPYTHTVTYNATSVGTDVVTFTVSNGTNGPASVCTANVGVSERPNNSPVCDNLSSYPAIGPDSVKPDQEFSFKCRGHDLDKDDISAFAFKAINKTNAQSVDLMEVICDGDSSPTVNKCINPQSCQNLTCSGITKVAGSTDGSFEVTLFGYKFPGEGDFRIQSKVKDSKGAWSNY